MSFTQREARGIIRKAVGRVERQVAVGACNLRSGVAGPEQQARQHLDRAIHGYAHRAGGPVDPAVLIEQPARHAQRVVQRHGGFGHSARQRSPLGLPGPLLRLVGRLPELHVGAVSECAGRNKVSDAMQRDLERNFPTVVCVTHTRNGFGGAAG